ncbi:MAG: carbamoyltransferase C-terminal domain-containing protein, partial [Myxococcota bacterium]
HTSQWFEHEGISPYMLMVAPVQPSKQIPMTEAQEKLFGIDKLNVPRSQIPAVTHVDYSARLQTVHDDTNTLYARLIRRFDEKTGCPVVVNTSFNVRGEPIVCTPADAFRCFMGTELDVLTVGRCVMWKSKQDQKLRLDYKSAFELD